MKKIILVVTLLIALAGSVFAGDKAIIVNNTDRTVKVKAETTAYERPAKSIITSEPHSEVSLDSFEDREYLFKQDREDTSIKFSEEGWFVFQKWEYRGDLYIEIDYRTVEEEWF